MGLSNIRSRGDQSFSRLIRRFELFLILSGTGGWWWWWWDTDINPYSVACFTYNPSPSIKLQGVYNLRKLVTTNNSNSSSAPAINNSRYDSWYWGGLQSYRATVSGAISYQLSPSHSLCTCVRLVQVHAASFLFVGRESSELAPFRQLPTREDTEGQLLSKHQPLPARLKGKLFSDWELELDQSCVALCVLSWNTNRYLLSRLRQQYFTQKKQTF